MIKDSLNDYASFSGGKMKKVLLYTVLKAIFSSAGTWVCGGENGVKGVQNVLILPFIESCIKLTSFMLVMFV